MKHSWLYLHALESESQLRRLVAFYVKAYNELMPHLTGVVIATHRVLNVFGRSRVSSPRASRPHPFHLHPRRPIICPRLAEQDGRLQMVVAPSQGERVDGTSDQRLM